MRPSGISIGVELGGTEAEVSFSFDGIVSWFQSLVSSNEESRARDEDPELRPFRSIRVICPCCSASVFHLTAVQRSEGLFRACRRCRSEFPVDL